jgi:hypothetical protein
MKGKVFGKLKVLHEDLSNVYKHTKWVCQCDCGEIKSIAGTHLRRGLIQSCGYDILPTPKEGWENVIYVIR